jgi:glycosyltransferase involved in cell wall biosynthesis
MIVGQVQEDIRRRWEAWANAGGENDVIVRWAGIVPHHQIPEIDRSAQMLFSADLNAACPNSVIEALACGTPVVAFDTGAIPELVPAGAGRIAPYGGNPWNLDTPDMPALVQAGMEVLAEGEWLRKGARARAEEIFNLDDMVAAYLQVLLDD